MHYLTKLELSLTCINVYTTNAKIMTYLIHELNEQPI